MITMEMIGKVRRMKLRDKLSNTAIAKLTGLSRNTVKKWLKAPGDVVPKYSRESPAGKLTAFEATLEQALTADSHRPKHGRRTAKALFTQIQAQGYLFDPDFCNVASGWEKGVVEKNVQDSRRRIWIEAGTRRFGSFIELNAWLGERYRSIWADTQHPVHKQFTVAEILELERAHLMNMPAPFDGYVEKSARVSSTCLVAVARNRYSVPCEWAGHMVSTRLYPNRVAVAAADTLVASHPRLTGSGQTTYDWQHYIDLVQRKPGALRNGAPFLDMPPPLLRLRQSLLRHTGGDRVMAEVLAVVPLAGLEEVLVAVELVLEGAAPSGSISAEHVRNVLARLNTPATPEQAQTSLQLNEAPRADTARYDRLRPTHQDGQEVSHA